MHYHIFGRNISQSLSPTIHNAAFTYHNFPHHYDIKDCESISHVEPLVQDAAFGGASVTMPHKLDVDRFCDQVSDSAVQLGAINTLIARQGQAGVRTICGDNTDWSGLYSIVVGYAYVSEVETGLVVGAGGAARAAVYAMKEAGFKMIYVWNRTFEKARGICENFGKSTTACTFTAVSHPSEIQDVPGVIIGTIPGEAMPKSSFVDLFRGSRGLCIEMAYKPRVTNLLSVAKTHSGWTTADGLEVLLRQAFDQYRLWTGKEAPYEVMRNAVQQAAAGNVARPTSDPKI